jgi:type I restriction enzyme S subunit
MSSVEVAQRFFEEFPAYSEYKDSGIDWLGEIPKHWEAKKIKMLCQVKRGASPRPIDSPIYFDDDGEYAWVRISDVTASDRYLLKTEQRLSKLGQSKSVALEPDELFLSIAGSVGKPIITKIKCCIHDGFVYFENLKENRDYLFYLFLGGELYKGLGKLGTQLNLNSDTVGSIVIPVPSFEDQKQIATFLDRATTEIDQIIEQQKQLITLLEEERTTVISHAVTKGLDPSVPMKYSGIEWLGNIPKHWKTGIRLKRIAKKEQNSFVNGPFGSDLLTSELVETGIPVIYIRDIKINKYIRVSESYITEQKSEQLSAFKTYPENILVTKVGDPPGIATVYPKGEPIGVVSQDVIRINIDSYLAYPRYISYTINSRFMRLLIENISVESTRNRISLGDFKQLKIILPPLEEQKQIASFLDQETARIDEAIDNVRSQIEKLEEYRTVLISDAVTGKIDVRGFNKE